MFLEGARLELFIVLVCFNSHLLRFIKLLLMSLLGFSEEAGRGRKILLVICASSWLLGV